MRRHQIISMIPLILWLGLAMGLGAVDEVAEPTELIELRQRYIDRQRAAVRPFLLEYKAELDRLQHILYSRKASPAALEAVEREKEKVATELDTTNPRGRVLSDDTPGYAGLQNINNVYKFNVNLMNKRVILRYWAVGNSNTNSYGNVVLTGPNGRPRTVDKWTPELNKKTGTEVQSYKSFSPREIAVSQSFSQPGEYRIEFVYEKGVSGLKILRVELEFK